VVRDVGRELLRGAWVHRGPARSFVGFNLALHIWRHTGVYVTFPKGRC
jgi:hypothetical protein